MIRYRVRSEQAEENERYIRAVFAELEERQPAELRYAAWKLADGVSFVHIASLPSGGNPLLELAAFQAFTARIKDRCDEPPVTTELDGIGSYRG